MTDTIATTNKRPRILKPAWHRTPCPDCGKPLIFTRLSGKSYRPHSDTQRWNYEWLAICRCGFEAKMTTPVYPERKG